VETAGIAGAGLEAPPVLTPEPGGALHEGIPPLPVAPGEYASQTDVERVAMKVYGRTPENMSVEERQKFTEWMSTAPIITEATTKAGCVHMTVRVRSLLGWEKFSLYPNDM
jgi:hypothetical protein